LGLRRTFVPDSLDTLSSLAPAPSHELTTDGSACDVRGRYHPGWVSHGVVASTPSEIARFFHALFGGRLIPSQSLREMQTVVSVAVRLRCPRPVGAHPATASGSWASGSRHSVGCGGTTAAGRAIGPPRTTRPTWGRRLCVRCARWKETRGQTRWSSPCSPRSAEASELAESAQDHLRRHRHAGHARLEGAERVVHRVEHRARRAGHAALARALEP